MAFDNKKNGGKKQTTRISRAGTTKRDNNSLRSNTEKPRRGFTKKDDDFKKYDRKSPVRKHSFEDSENERPRRSYGSNTSSQGENDSKKYDRRPVERGRSFNDNKGNKPWRGFTKKDDDFEKTDRKPTVRKRNFDDSKNERPRSNYGSSQRENDSKKYDRKPSGRKRSFNDNEDNDKPRRNTTRRFTSSDGRSKSRSTVNKEFTRLNRYIARSGVCSRREADELIAAGEVKVNGTIVTEMGVKVSNSDRVHVGDQLISFERPVYLLLNKPKDYITTTDDPMKRKTVMMLVSNACKEHILPVGRLDRNTTGLLLFTNDGDMAKKLTHPSGKIRKVYHVHLDKALTKADMIKISEGVELDDGFIKPDVIVYAGTGNDKKEIGLELHSGRNRIVRRIFEELGYEVVKLDRVIFANLTKKDLKRGHYRFLTPQEVAWLKML